MAASCGRSQQRGTSIWCLAFALDGKVLILTGARVRKILHLKWTQVDGEPDSAPFKVHLLTRSGRIMRARSEPVRAFSNKDEAVRFAGRQLGGHYAVYHKHKKIWPAR
jgi:hypothetical protein